MRAGRFGSKAGRVAVVAALVLGTLALGAVPANAAELTSTDGSAAATVGQSVAGLAISLVNGWE